MFKDLPPITRALLLSNGLLFLLQRMLGVDFSARRSSNTVVSVSMQSAPVMRRNDRTAPSTQRISRPSIWVHTASTYQRRAPARFILGSSSISTTLPKVCYPLESLMTRPSCVTHVSRTIWSSKFSCRSPSFMRSCRSDEMFREYI